MHNPVILFIHVGAISALTLMALRFGKELAIAWLAMLAVAMNLFVLKQISLFGWDVTSSDALAVGYLLGLNLIQEFFGKKLARRTVWITFFVASGFALLSQIHLCYLPNTHDLSNPHFTFLLSPTPRLLIASLSTFVIVQVVDLAFFGFLREKTGGKFLTLRTIAALIFSQTLDTVLFSFLGLYGLVFSVGHIIFLSLCVKGLVILLNSPFIRFSKKIISYDIQV